MSQPAVPAGYRSVSAYLVVEDADAAVRFVERVFGAEERRRETGEAGGVHVELELGDSILMVGAVGGTTFPAMLHVYVEDSDAVYRRALEAGATSVAEPHDTSDGRDHRSAFDDPWGNQWWVATRIRPAS